MQNMSFNRLLGVVRQRLWQVPKRPRSTNTASEKLQGPEPPNGFLFNEKPLLPGEKRQKESWENVWVYGMTFNLLLVIGIVAFKPDTTVSGWAREKAHQRLADEESNVSLADTDSNEDS